LLHTIDGISISNTILDYTQTVYVINNLTKLEALSYIQAKDIFEIHNKTNNTFQIVTITIIIILTVIITFYYKYL